MEEQNINGETYMIDRRTRDDYYPELETTDDIKAHIEMLKHVGERRREKQRLIEKTVDFLDAHPKEKFTIDDFCKKTGVPRHKIWLYFKCHDIPQKNIDQLIVPESWLS